MAFMIQSPLRILRTPGGFRIVDAGRTLAYIYCRPTPEEASVARVLLREDGEELAKRIARGLMSTEEG